ncbi:S41 family peptidase [Candidatus Cytomitobacter indipagum]|nr:S41 family peptidase [Candidatus Cytomitobacter indipagum]
MVSHETLWSWSKENGLNRWAMLQNTAIDLSLSPNGKHLAFTGSEDSKSDVYIIDINSHKPIRKTFYGGSTYVVGWLDNDNIIYATNYELPFKNQFQLFVLNIKDDSTTKIPCGHAGFIAYDGKNKPVIQRFGYGYSNWRGYKGGTVGDLWIASSDKFNLKNSSNANFIKLPFENSNALSPLWVKDRLFFLSDCDGIGNIYEYNVDEKSWKQQTNHDDFYARGISKYDEDKILYSKAGDIYCFNVETGKDEKLDIEGPSYSFEQDKFYNESNYELITSGDVNNKGSEVSCAIRGKVFSKALWNKGHKLRNGNIRCRIAFWNKDNILVTIQDNENDSIITYHDKEESKFKVEGIGRIEKYIISENNIIATINNRNEMWLIDIDKKNAEKILDNGNKFRGFDWSPDGKWIVYSRMICSSISSLFLYNLDSKKHTQITPSEFKDASPSFDPKGKYIYFLSFRDLKTEFDPMSFNLYFKHGAKPYAISLEKDSKDPFVDWMNVKDEDDEDDDLEDEVVISDENKEAKAAESDKKDDEEEIEPTKIDLDGIELRTFASSIKPGKYHKLIAIEDKLLISHDKKLDVFNFQNPKLENIVSDMTSYKLSQNKKWIIYANEEKLRIGQAGSKFEENDTSHKKGGWVAVDDIEVEIDPSEEWTQILNEVWWLTKEHFWESSMNNIDWDSMKSKYQSLVKKIKSRNELNSIIADMIGELKTSHAYVLEKGDVFEPEHRFHGYLGAKFTKVETGFKIDEIYYNKNCKSPLHLNAKAGDIVTSVNGHDMNNKKDVHIYLNKENNSIILNNDKEIYIKPMKSWSELSYHRWIEKNVSIIKNRSDKIGYVHIPDMVENGFQEFYRRYIFEHRKDALVVDARYNSGGFLSSLILDKLQRRRSAYSIPRHGTKDPYPDESPSGPMILLCNEYTGSDGDIFTRMFKELKLGPVIGKRTWGGVVGICPRYYLIDGGLTSQPEYGISMNGTGLDMENNGVEPDVEVGIFPQDFENNHDPQLEYAIDLLLEKI